MLGIVNLLVGTEHIVELYRRKTLEDMKRLGKSCDYAICVECGLYVRLALPRVWCCSLV